MLVPGDAGGDDGACGGEDVVGAGVGGRVGVWVWVGARVGDGDGDGAGPEGWVTGAAGAVPTSVDPVGAVLACGVPRAAG